MGCMHRVAQKGRMDNVCASQGLAMILFRLIVVLGVRFMDMCYGSSGT